MNCSNEVLASGINPFDESYHHLHHQFDVRILHLLSTILCLNITLVKTPLVTDLNNYEKNPDIWILEQVLNGTAEISSTSFVLTPDTPIETQYTFGIGTFRPQLYYKARSLREEHNIYLLPFSSKLWYCLISTLIISTFVLTFILSREVELPHQISYDIFARIIDLHQDRDEQWTEELQNASEESLHQREKWEMGEILLVCLGVICQQGSARDPSTNAARLLLLVLFFLAVVAYTAYSANIISLISLFPSTENELTRNIDAFSDEYNTLLLNTRKMSHLKLNYKFIEHTTLKKGFNEALKGEAVFVGDRDVSLTFLHQQKYNADMRCTLGRVFIGVEYHRVLALKKDSIYKDRINYNILRLKQFGLVERERRRIFHVKPPCATEERTSQSNFVSFDKNDVKPILNLLLLAVLTSILLLLIENIIFYCPKRFTRSIFRYYNKVRRFFRKTTISFQPKKSNKKNSITKKIDNKILPMDMITDRPDFPFVL